MRRMRLRLPDEVVPDWAGLRSELGIVEPFPPEALAEVDDEPRLPELDRTDLDLLTVDPPGSVDLDQAMHLERTAGGYRVSYAIADVTAFVRPGSALDAESRRRGSTLYAPDRRVPMLPPALSEDRASLLPDQVRPALLWSLDVDGDGELVGIDVRRAMVRSRRRLDYVEALELDLLREVGELLERRAAERGAVSLPTPEQEVSLAGERPVLRFRAPLASERWNEQISLLTGRAAARLMLDGRIGLLRTLPSPDPADVEALRRSALALGVSWPADRPYAEVVSGLDPTSGPDAAVLALVPRLLRGAAYVAFDGEVPEQPLHSAVAAPYAHCTAPLRRLGDRFVGETCLALAAGTEVPAWVREALPQLPELLGAADKRGKALDRAAVDLAEAVVLGPCVGEVFRATVVSEREVQLAEPAVRASVEGSGLPVGEVVDVRLVVADAVRRRVVFEPA
jgi:exoribonuclease R